MPNPTPQSIVEKLSEAQREVFRRVCGREVYAELLCGTAELGLVVAEVNPDPREDAPIWVLTPLGEQVFAILSRKEQNDG